MKVLQMFRGDDKVYELTVTNRETGAPVDITGTTLTMTWKENITDTSYFLQKTATLTDPTNGKAEFAIDAADTSSLTGQKEYFFDVQITKVGGEVETLLLGKVIVFLDVT